MPRDTFPYESDRHAIELFLRGKGNTTVDPALGALMSSAGKTLVMTGSAHTVAWYDTAGALCAKLLDGYLLHYCSAAIDEITKQLGLADRTIVREDRGWTGPDDSFTREYRYFFDNAPIEINQPFVLCGPVGVLAWRTANKVKR